MEDDRITPYELTKLAKKFEANRKSRTFDYYEPRILHELVGHYLEEGNPEYAIEICEIGMEQHPFETSFYGQAAELHNNGKRVTTAMRIIEKALSIEPGHAEHLMLKAQILESMRKPIEAEELYDRVVENGGDIDEVRIRKANNCINLGEPERGVELVREIFSKKIKSEHLFYEALMYLELINRLEAGIEMLEGYLDEDPYSATGWCGLGHIYNETGEPKKAIWAYDFAIAIDENYADAYLQKGYCFTELGDYENAAESFNEYLRLDAPDPLSYTNMADCYRMMKQFEKAEETYRKALEIDPNYSEAWFGLGLVASGVKNHKEAAEFYKRAHELEPADDLCLLQLIDTYKKLGYWSQAEKLLTKMLKTRTEYQHAYVWLANAQAQQGKYDEAIVTIEKWLEKRPEDDQIWYQKAAYLYLQGEEKKGLDSLCHALLLNPETVETFFEFAPGFKDHEKVKQMIDLYSNEL